MPPRRTAKDAPAKLAARMRSWRVPLLRGRAQPRGAFAAQAVNRFEAFRPFDPLQAHAILSQTKLLHYEVAGFVRAFFS
jgi:hypothetical protein